MCGGREDITQIDGCRVRTDHGCQAVCLSGGLSLSLSDLMKLKDCVYCTFVAKVKMQTQSRKVYTKLANFKCMCARKQNSWKFVCSSTHAPQFRHFHLIFLTPYNT